MLIFAKQLKQNPANCTYWYFHSSFLMEACGDRVVRTLGTNTRHRVIVVANRMRVDRSMNEWSASSITLDTPILTRQTNITTYTLIPMYLLSFNAGIVTLLVSQARKQPNSWNVLFHHNNKFYSGDRFEKDSIFLRNANRGNTRWGSPDFCLIIIIPISCDNCPDNFWDNDFSILK